MAITMDKHQLWIELNKALSKVNPGECYNASDDDKIDILKDFLPKANLRIGQVINRHNEAGDSFNRIIGFMINWHCNGNSYYISDEDIHIICDRVKRYNKSYSCFNNKLEFYHGEIWALSELIGWRERGDIVEDTPQAELAFNEAKANAVKQHECCFADRMLTW